MTLARLVSPRPRWSTVLTRATASVVRLREWNPSFWAHVRCVFISMTCALILVRQTQPLARICTPSSIWCSSGTRTQARASPATWCVPLRTLLSPASGSASLPLDPSAWPPCSSLAALLLRIGASNHTGAQRYKHTPSAHASPPTAALPLFRREGSGGTALHQGKKGANSS